MIFSATDPAPFAATFGASSSPGLYLRATAFFRFEGILVMISDF
jgi:hypothetical protein